MSRRVTEDYDARQLAVLSPASMAHVCSGGRWVPFEHLILLNDFLVRVCQGDLDRLVVTMPPQHGKSELVSHWMPAWFLGCHPTRKVLLGSYQSTFAASWSRKARDTLHEFGPWLFGVDWDSDHKAADWWFTDRGGYMAADGLGGAFTGKGAHLMIVDDPIKGYEEAASVTMRQKAWDWWAATLSSRLQQRNAVVLVQTRWHEDDLAGRLLDRFPGEWTVVNLPALAEENDLLGREVGAPLCPELHDLDQLESTRRGMGEYWFSALYQQRPAPEAGFLFKREYFREWWREMVGADSFFVLGLEGGPRRYREGECLVFQTVDTAASEKETADFTVVATWARTPDAKLCLLDVQRQHFEAQHVPRFLARVNDQWGRCPMHVETVGGHSSIAAYQVLRVQGRAVAQLKPDQDKLVRAQHAIVAYERGDVFHPRSAPQWLDAFEAELLTFPNSRHDDQVDVTAYATRLLPRLGVSGGRQDVERPHTIMRGVMSEQY